MKTKAFVGAITIAFAGVGLWAGYLFRELGIQRTRADSEANLRSVVEAKLAAYEPSESVERLRRIDPITTLEGDSKHEKPVDAITPVETQSISGINANERAAIRRMSSQAVQLLYGDLVKRWKLKPEDEKLFKEQLIDLQTKFSDLKTMGVGAASLSQAKQELQSQSDAAALALLGPDKFQQYQDYSRDLPDHAVVMAFRNELATMAKKTLNDSEEKKLFNAISEERQLIPMPASGSVSQRRQWTDDYNSRVLARAKTILSADQFAAFQEMQVRQGSSGAGLGSP